MKQTSLITLNGPTVSEPCSSNKKKASKGTNRCQKKPN